jgi:hypothetical protein
MGDVVVLDVVTSLPLPPDRVLEAALGKLQTVVVIGYMEDGNEYFASSESAGPEVLWLMERAKLKLLEIVDG